ncbi:hypothetical protein GCM10027589_25460 [Actinocorallia lasiicapitis]
MRPDGPPHPLPDPPNQPIPMLDPPHQLPTDHRRRPTGPGHPSEHLRRYCVWSPHPALPTGLRALRFPARPLDARHMSVKRERPGRTDRCLPGIGPRRTSTRHLTVSRCPVLPASLRMRRPPARPVDSRHALPVEGEHPRLTEGRGLLARLRVGRSTGWTLDARHALPVRWEHSRFTVGRGLLARLRVGRSTGWTLDARHALPVRREHSRLTEGRPRSVRLTLWAARLSPHPDSRFPRRQMVKWLTSWHGVIAALPGSRASAEPHSVA